MGRDEESALVERYEQLVLQVARKHFPSRLPDDDLLQHGLIGLWEAAKSWDEIGSFESYAKTCIYHNMMDYVRALTAKKRESAEELRESDAVCEYDYQDLDMEDLRAYIDQAWPAGSTENSVLTSLSENYDKRLTADELGLTVRQVTRTAKRAWRAVQSAREAIDGKE